MSDGGVRVDQLDAAKLSEWWLCKIGTDFQPDEASEIGELICNFCIWDARYYYFVFFHSNILINNSADFCRLEYEYSANESNLLDGVNWWSGHDTNMFFCNYYYRGMEHSMEK